MLEIRELTVRLGKNRVVHLDNLDLAAGGRLGLVGESGSGKTVTAMAIAGLLPAVMRVSGSIRLDGVELVGLGERRYSRIRGRQIGVVFQDPLRALNPVMRVGNQVAEAVRLDGRARTPDVRARVVELLDTVHLDRPVEMLNRYPHQLSGGQRQRVLIAIAIARRPKLLIADEPTTALDVTVQQGILNLLRELSIGQGMSLLFIGHDLGVVRCVSEDLAVMYGGQLMEIGPGRGLVERPRNRYTEALVAANPSLELSRDPQRISGPLHTIPGSIPVVGEFLSGCHFRGRCAFEVENCRDEPRATYEADGKHRFHCWNPNHSYEGKLAQ